jgi:DNA (cytosine-5)-methyltransferase 1
MEKIKLLYIDLFCGAGGTSTGVESARHNGEKCAKVIACVNHDANAIASHAANHPDALHFTEDIRTLGLSPLVAHLEKMKAEYPEALVVLWASLECTNFSKAKGGKPRDVDSRTLALHLFKYIEAINPNYIQIENVEEFTTRSWTKSDKDGKALTDNSDYLQWVEHVKSYGYTFKYRILNAADYGAYTSRKRFFGIFAKNELPIAFPNPTRSKTGGKNLFDTIKKWKAVKDVLDFSDEGESIFNRKKPLSDKTLERICAGLIKFVARGKDKWMLKYNSINGETGKHIPPSVDEPCPVVACQSRLGVVQAKFLSKYYSGHPESKNFSVEEPAHTVTPIDHHALINASFIQQRNSGNPSHKVASVEHPARTITATGGNQELAQSKFIVNSYSGGGQHSSIDEVCPAVLTQPKQNIVSYFMMNPQFFNKGSSVENPCFTLIARMDKMPPYLIKTETGQLSVGVYETDSEAMRKIKEFMAYYGIIDIKMRMLRIPELKRIMGFPEDYTLIGTQAEQKKYIGNAVEVNMAKCLCEALVTKLYEV